MKVDEADGIRTSPLIFEFCLSIMLEQKNVSQNKVVCGLSKDSQSGGRNFD